MTVSIALRINGELRDTQTDLSPETVFPIYSITKTLTAICALRLAGLGSLHLDLDVRQWPTATGLRHFVAMLGAVARLLCQSGLGCPRTTFIS